MSGGDGAVERAEKAFGLIKAGAGIGEVTDAMMPERTLQEQCYGTCWAACERIAELESGGIQKPITAMEKLTQAKALVEEVLSTASADVDAHLREAIGSIGDAVWRMEQHQ